MMRVPLPLAVLTAAFWLVLAGALAFTVPVESRYSNRVTTLAHSAYDLPATVRAATTTATAAAIAVSPTVTAYIATARAGTATARAAVSETPTAEPTLCPLPPIVLTVSCCGGVGPECTATIAAYRRAVCEGLGTQAALTATTTPTAPATATPTDTALPTDEPTPTLAPPPTPTATLPATATARPVWRAYAPFAYLRRGRR